MNYWFYQSQYIFENGDVWSEGGGFIRTMEPSELILFTAEFDGHSDVDSCCNNPIF